MKKQELIATLNTMLTLCEPIKYDDFNKVMKAKDVKKLRDVETRNQKIGIANFDKENEGISTLSIIATITDVLCDERLTFVIDQDTNVIKRVKWYTPSK